MQFSSQPVGAFRHVLYSRGNRQAPEAERASVLIRPLRSLELAAQAGWVAHPDEVYAWRDKALKRYLDNPDYGDLIRQIPFTLLLGLRQFMGHASEFRHWIIDGQEQTDPVVIFFSLCAEDFVPGPDAPMANAGRDAAEGDAEREHRQRQRFEKGDLSPIAEVQYVIRQTAYLKGDELKNFVAQCGGSSVATSTAPSVLSDGAPAAA